MLLESFVAEGVLVSLQMFVLDVLADMEETNAKDHSVLES